MYHAFVRSKLTQTLEGLDKENFADSLSGMDSQIEHSFAGTHAIGGTRHSTTAVERWFGRVFRLFPDLSFKVKRIAVSGWPWDTTATAEWQSTATSVTGEPYLNDGVHIVRLRLGKIVSMHVYLDTQVLADVCRVMAEKGVEEASAPQSKTELLRSCCISLSKFNPLAHSTITRSPSPDQADDSEAISQQRKFVKLNIKRLLEITYLFELCCKNWSSRW